MKTTIKNLSELQGPEEALPPSPWQVRAIQSEECLSYMAWNDKTQEAIVVDPKLEDMDAYRTVAKQLEGYLWLAVIDTHTHADHLSSAAALADELDAPLVMHHLAPSQKVHIRVSQDTTLPAHGAPLRLILTPGHTQDSITPIWGPFIFGGDTILYGDSGRDDLPTGDAERHYESLQRLKAEAKPEMVMLPGHDNTGGRASSWATQLRVNASLTQDKSSFVRESNAFDAPAPAQLKKSLRENFK